MEDYKHFLIDIDQGVAKVSFNRPEKANALHEAAWIEMGNLFRFLDESPEVRVVVLSGEGKHFCAGIDLELLMDIGQFTQIDCGGKRAEKVLSTVKMLQEKINAIEQCRKPVLAAIHRGCIGGGVDIISACDMRYCTEDAYFTIKEVDMGLVADLGTLQRLPKLISPGLVSELAYTGRKLTAGEAEQTGLSNKVYQNKEDMLKGVLEIAQIIAQKSPLVVRGTKQTLLHSRDHAVGEGLDRIALWNAAMLLSNDLQEAFMASMQKRVGVFED